MCCPCCASENYGFLFYRRKKTKKRGASTFNHLILMGSKKITLAVSTAYMECIPRWDWVVRVPNMDPKVGHPASSRSEREFPILDLFHGFSAGLFETHSRAIFHPKWKLCTGCASSNKNAFEV